MEFFRQKKGSVAGFIDAFLQKKRKAFSDVNLWGEDALDRLESFLQSGKMVRGGLVCLGHEVCTEESSPVVFPAAAAVEFVQAALLIHDDIIDRDNYRRGLPSLPFQYRQKGEKEGVAEPDHFGQGMAICLGDIGFFLAFELFSELEVPHAIKESIIRLWAQELSYVGLAQMQDLYLSETRSDFGDEEILQLYLYKTARYSFSLPLMTGGIIADGDPKLLEDLEKCGRAFGLLFQLKDDELGLYGSEKELGKPVGSDLKECKKTLHYFYLQQKARNEDVKRLEEICREGILSPDMVQEVRDMLEKYEVGEIINQRMAVLRKELEQRIAGLDIPARYRDIFYELLDFSLYRKK